MTTEQKHITICICTFKRPDLLRRLLGKLVSQRTDTLFGYSVIVVDNDRNKSAQETVQDFQRESDLEVRYFVEPEQNIALARNRAVENAKGDFIAFIDDDEFPETEWLLNLYSACRKYGSDGVLGPVKPYFEESCPKWIIKANLCERTSHPTGTVMHPQDTRSGNVLLKSDIFDDPDNRFDPQFGRTGGEDVAFFVNVIGKGRVFVWCDEAPVYEALPLERQKASYYLRRSIRMGGLTGEEMRRDGSAVRRYPLVVAAVCAYATMLPFAACCGKHLFMKYLVKGAYHFSWLSGFFGHVFIRFRDD